jgi:hypothetical protein
VLDAQLQSAARTRTDDTSFIGISALNLLIHAKGGMRSIVPAPAAFATTISILPPKHENN